MTVCVRYPMMHVFNTSARRNVNSAWVDIVLRVVRRAAAGLATGVVAGALYSGLTGGVHLALYGHWDRVPIFAVGSILAFGLLGVVGGIGHVWFPEAKREEPSFAKNRTLRRAQPVSFKEAGAER